MTSKARSFKDPNELVRVLKDQINFPDDTDLSQEILIFVALAIHAAERLKSIQPEILELNNREILLPWLYKAFREALYIRPRLSTDTLTQKSFFKIKLTRFGRIDSTDK